MGARISVRKVRLAGYARVAGALSLPVLALTGLANRFGLMPFYAVLPALVIGFLLAIVAAVMAVFALTAIWQDGGRGAASAFIGIVYALPALALAGMTVFAVVAYPRISDVTTDAADPPQFRVLKMGHASVENAEPGDRAPVEIATAAARLFPVAIDTVYSAVDKFVAARGWDVAQAIAPAGEDGTATIEASAKTLLFAFTDDVVIRLVGTPQGTRVDMRSASRWGRHDLGQNARRIRAFMKDLDGALQGLFAGTEEPEEEPGEDPGEEPASDTGGGLLLNPVIEGVR